MLYRTAATEELAHAAASIRNYGRRHRPDNAQTREALPVLASAVAFAEPDLLADHTRWAAAVASARGNPTDDISAAFVRLHHIAETLDPRDCEIVDALLADAEARAPAIGEDEPVDAHPLSRHYLDALLRFDSPGARRLVEQALAGGLPVHEVYGTILEPALVDSGNEWEGARISVAREHYITDVTIGIMNVLSESAPRAPARNRTFVALCVEGERHEVGLRMIRDLLSISGWKTVYLGADVPTEEIATVLRDTTPAVVGISVTMAGHLGSAREAIHAIRRIDPRLRIVTGGRPFRICGDLWPKLGADAGLGNGRDAAAVIERLAESATPG